MLGAERELGRRAPGRQASTMIAIRSSTSPSAGSVRPPVSAYGRTTGPSPGRPICRPRPSGQSTGICAAGNLGRDAKCGPARFTSIAIS